MQRWFLVTIAMTLALAALVLANPGVVKTKSGLRYEGDVFEDRNSVIISVRGVQTKLDRADVESIDYTPSGTFREQYAQRHRKLDPRDVAGHLALARIALDAKEYDLALDTVDEALGVDPTNEEAITLRATIRQQERTDRAQNSKPAATEKAAEPAEPPDAAPQANPVEKRFISADDIQQIRRAELRFGDKARVQIPQDIRKAYAAKAGMTFTEFNRLPANEQALAILVNGDDAMRSQVRVMSDPESLVEFKRLSPMISSGCATSNCHGGTSGGDLILFQADTEPATYTNFYILTQYSKKVASEGSSRGFFQGAAERKMIDRGRGEQSLLAQYGLPSSRANLRHPPVPGYNGIFRDLSDSRYKRLLDWINNSLVRLEPAYKISYRAPHGAKSRPMLSNPSTQPAK